jgi:hypothetical protein
MLDQYYGSKFPKNPNIALTATDEITQARKKIKQWARFFPHLKICWGNHSIRWQRRLLDNYIPSSLMRNFKEIFDLPEGWQYAQKWNIDNNFIAIHGEGFSGINAHRTACLVNGINTVIGHLHSNAGISHIKTAGQQIWGMNVGCLIDPDSFAFEYGKNCKFKPSLGAGVIVNGEYPIWVPL